MVFEVGLYSHSKLTILLSNYSIVMSIFGTHQRFYMSINFKKTRLPPEELVHL